MTCEADWSKRSTFGTTLNFISNLRNSNAVTGFSSTHSYDFKKEAVNGTSQDPETLINVLIRESSIMKNLTLTRGVLPDIAMRGSCMMAESIRMQFPK